ncbi:MAG: hypothetical protein H7X93_08670 [Sphingomonadaceae bacterium]|nr:hypothetical protein [Sphingomonadaceae bacterium]
MIKILIILLVLAVAAAALIVLMRRSRRIERRDEVLTIDATPAPPPPAPVIADSPEGADIGDQIAAAMKDIAGEMAGVEAQPEAADDDEIGRDVGAPASIAAGGAGDELGRIKGLGPRAAEKLAAMGVVRFEQIAAWSPEEAERIEAEIGMNQGRIARDQWVEQAGYLARGDTASFEERFGKLG